MASGYEELSFGGDPDREPRIRAWAAARAGRLAVCGAALAAAGAVGVHLYGSSRTPPPPPDAPFPVQLRFLVFTCDADPGPGNCSPQEGAAHRRTLAGRMRAMPELAEVTVVTGEEQHRRVVAEAAVTGEWTGPADRALFADELGGTLRRSGDFAAVAARIEAMPGVYDVFRVPTDFWAGRADLAVILCGTDGWSIQECPRNRPPGAVGAATDTEKEAIFAWLRGRPGVEAVHLEDRGHAARLQRHYNPELPAGDRRFRADVINESFRVKLSGPAAAPEIAKGVRSRPGVRNVQVIGSR
ncbi:hypothetical protein GCM10010466_55140 [Planomonospora alba]|uniref:FtsX extracellular domain-containing protein n=1 Tax=Planomonospora alba TaxID=161354 RepID=A0ABP6NTP6_9ACTN